MPPSYRRTSGRRWQPLLYAALLVTALGVAFLLTQFRDQGGATAARPTSAASPAKTTVPVAPNLSEPPTGNDQGGNEDAPRGTDKKLEGFVMSYYSDVTKDTDRTWDRLSPRMQDAAGGREGYDSFWRTIDRVKVNTVKANDSGTNAVVNLTFTRDDGTRSTETHEFTFVAEDKGYLIDGDQLRN